MQSNIRNLWFGASFTFAAVLGLFSTGFIHGLVGLVTFNTLDDAAYAALMATPAVGFTCGIVLIGLVAFVLGYIGLAAYDAVTSAMSRNRLNVLRNALFGEETPSREAFVDCFELSPELTQAARQHAERLYIYATRKKQSGTAFSVLRASQSAGQTFRDQALVDRRLLVWLFRVLPPAFVGTGVFSFAAALAAGTPVGIASAALAVAVFGAMIVVVLERGVTGFRHAQVAALCEDIDSTFKPSGESVSLEEIIHASHESAELIANATLATQEDFRATMQAASKEIAEKLDQNSSTIVNTLTETAKGMGPDVSDAVTKALSEPIETLRSATETATSEQSEQVRELIDTILKGFVSELKSIVGDEFNQLDQLIKASTESAGKLEKVYSEAFDQMADHSSTLRAELADEFKGIIEGLKAQESEWAKAQGEALGSVAGEFKSVIETLKTEEAERVKAQTESVGSLIGEFKSIVDTLKTEESERVRTQIESVNAVLGEFKAAVETMKAEEAERVRTQSDSMKTMTTELGDSVKAITDGLSASIKEIAGSASAETKEMATALTAETKDIAAAMAADANRHVEAFNEALDRAMTSLESMANQQLQQTTDDLSRTALSFETLHTSLENIVTLMSPMISQVIENQESLLRAIESESSNSRVLSRAASEMSAAAQVSRTTVDRFLALAEVLRETSTNIGRAANTNLRGKVSPPKSAKRPALKASGGSSFGDAIRQLRQTSHEDADFGEE